MTTDQQRFEAAHRHLCLDKHPRGRYLHPHVQSMFDGWLAHAAAIRSHREAWRAALETMAATSPDVVFWWNELRAFDEATR